MADCIISNLIQELGVLVAKEYQVIQSVEGELRSLDDTLRFMKRFLRNSEGKHDKHDSVSELVKQIHEVAFEVEDVIENFILQVEKHQRMNSFKKACHVIKHTSMLRKVAQQIDGIRKRINDIYDNKEKFEIDMDEGGNNYAHFEANLLRRRKEVDKNMVGFRDVEESLLKKIIEGSDAREIISVVGMGGLGKTTVARILYNHRIVEDHFTCRAWVTVSEDYDTRQVLLEILYKVAFNVDDLNILEIDELKENLRERLENKKYIVFLDDVWQKNMWDEVEAYFPDNKNGSRVLITTRNTEVARHASTREPHFLRFLNVNESWELFEKKVFKGNQCPPHLKMVGMNIVKRCKGLPLSIVVIASMLSSQEKSERIWEKTLRDVGAHLEKDEVCLDILALSYHSLPVVLKPCLLYFAAFPEDYEMSVKRLIVLWLAEGFVQPLGELSLEEVAESYLDDLIDRSLVQVGKRRLDGGMKTCRMHDLVRDLCIREARRENFLWVAFGIQNSSKIKPRRLSINHHATQSFPSKHWDSSSIRAVLSSEAEHSSALWKKLVTESKLIRVLDLGISVNVQNIPDDLSSLVNLRYLRLQLKLGYVIPAAIYELRNLKMLFLKTQDGDFKIPLRMLLKLDHLEQLDMGMSMIMGNLKMSKMEDNRQKQLRSLWRLSSVFPNTEFENAIMNGLCSDLRKLSMWSSYTHQWSLTNIFSGLPNLESLKLSFEGTTESCFSNLVMHQITANIKAHDFPSSLTKVTLKSKIITHLALQMLGTCPNLRILKLSKLQNILHPPDDDTQVLTPKGAFPSLRTLHLDCVRGVYFTKFLGEEAFVQLRYVFAERCLIYDFHHLLELPSLSDVEILMPDQHISQWLEKLKKDNKIKYRLFVYRG